MEFIASIILVAVIVLLFTLYNALTWGFVLYKFWYWFLLPVFPMLTEISYILSVGLIMFMTLFHTHSSLNIKDEYKDKSKEYYNTFLAPWLTLLMGWIVKLFIL